MRIIVDVNPLISALLKDSTSRDIIVKSEQDFCFPEASVHKIRKYKAYILEKTGFSDLEFLIIFHTLLRFIENLAFEIFLGSKTPHFSAHARFSIPKTRPHSCEPVKPRPSGRG